MPMEMPSTRKEKSLREQDPGLEQIFSELSKVNNVGSRLDAVTGKLKELVASDDEVERAYAWQKLEALQHGVEEIDFESLEHQLKLIEKDGRI